MSAEISKAIYVGKGINVNQLTEACSRTKGIVNAQAYFKLAYSREGVGKIWAIVVYKRSTIDGPCVIVGARLRVIVKLHLEWVLIGLACAEKCKAALVHLMVYNIAVCVCASGIGNA